MTGPGVSPEADEPQPAPIAGTADQPRAEPAAGTADELQAEPHVPRPWIERIGLAGIALVLAALFGTVAAAAWSGGEVFLAAMGAVGCLMTVWVGILTVVRG
ncbi:MAG: hypothetical protein ACHQ3P_06915 [Candidatus Limnocylindrales bacterium]